MAGLKLLVVDDSPTDTEILLSHLKKLPDLTSSVVQATRGADGLRSVRVTRPDLVLLDMHLPDMTGIEFLELLRQETHPPAVVVLTGSSDEHTAVQAMKTGALDYLSKNALSTPLLERTLKNVWERYQLELELVKTRVQLTTMIQEAGVGMALLDLHLNLLHANSALLGFAGLEGQEVQGKALSELDSPLLGQLEWMCQRVLYSGKTFRDQEVSTDSQQEVRYWQCSVYPVLGRAGKVQWVGITATDITRSKQTALLLQQNQDRLDLTLEATQVGTWQWDSQTRRLSTLGQTRSILGLSGTAEAPNVEEVLRQIYAQDLEHARTTLKEAVRTGSNFGLEMRLQHGDETIRWVMSRGRVDHTEDRTRISGTLIDITDLKEAELALREISQTQQRFVNDAAHELRAPLTAIQGNLDLIHRYSNMPEEDRQEALADVAKEATRLSRLVQDMLALAKGDAGTQLRMEPTALAEVLEDALSAVSFQLRPHQVSVKTCDARVMGDPDRLKQVMVILLENAAKYTPDGGHLQVGMLQKGQEVCFWVKDSGMGIAEADQPRVFERFYRGQLSREADPGGTGLGLPIAKWIVEAHQGSIQLQSQLGQGTCVVVHLPALNGE
ncbi:ATP-binding response regulator [Deinococcus misasensis]|uniref:ATP-binding response regulator n=1 Tax=Deinococcus misasensis TaxID=392413 RepID=UPI00068B4B0C|nr:hybrid sensor histidine kinase/response regulator [Deinococcus misasensis]